MDAERKHELQERIHALTKLADDFHVRATTLGAFSFIQFSGLMYEMIRVYQLSLDNGVDYLLANESVDTPLMAWPGHLDFINVKLNKAFSHIARVNVRPRTD